MPVELMQQLVAELALSDCCFPIEKSIYLFALLTK
jgi:hypothetical protein